MAQLAFISETKCGEFVARNRINKLPLCNAIVVPSKGRSGGLWLIWNDDVRVSLVHQSRSLIVVDMHLKGVPSEWRLMAVYGDPTRVQNVCIWEDIELYMEDYAGPTCVIGDFNAITSSSEKWGGIDYMSSPNKAFKAWIQNVGLIDLGHNGPAYTWSNKQTGSACISEQLDRALGNLAWTMTYPETSVFHLPRFSSDHLPILLRPKPPTKKPTPSFRTENWWLLHDDFNQVCDKVTQDGRGGWQQVAKDFKGEVGKWLKKKKSPNELLKGIEAEMLSLNSIQGGAAENIKEVELQRQHTTYLLMLEKFWHQRSRVNWSAFGDRNTDFFHASAITRKRRNSITTLMIRDGIWESDQKKIKRAFIEHFKQIYKKGQTRAITEVYPPSILSGLPKIPDLVYFHLDALS